MRSLSLMLCALLGMATSVPALAQDMNRFDIGLSGQVRYDSNVARSDASIAVARGIEPDDVLFRPALNIDVLQGIGALSVFAEGTVAYDFYSQNEQLNRERLDVRAGLLGRFGPCRATSQASYARRQSDLLDLTQETTENVESVGSVGLDASCGDPVGLVPTLSFSQQWANNSAALLITSDYETFSSTGGIAYRQPSFGELSLFGQYVQTDFPNRIVLFAASPTTDGYELYAGGVRYRREFGASIEGVVSSAYTSLNPKIPGTTDFEGITYGAEITFRPTARITTHFLVDRAARPSNRLDVTFSVDETYQIDAQYTLGANWTLQIGGSWIYREFEGAALNPNATLTDEQVDVVFGSIRVELTDRLSLVLDSRREARNASILDYSYESVQVGLSATAAF